MVFVKLIHLKIVHLKCIDTTTSSNEFHLDLFPLEEALQEFLGIFTKLPSFHHKHQFPYCLNSQAYFRESIMSIKKEDSLSHDEEIISLSHPEDRSTLLKGDTIDVIMDGKAPDKVIQVGKCLSSKESKVYSNLLH